MADLPPHYSPKDVEERLYQWLESQGMFQAEATSRRRSYTIVIPPPNVTGILHMGHALNNTIQDILIRQKRMEGYNALWVPGTDHAGIATQNVVEKALAKEGKRRQDLGREAFVERVWQWKQQYGDTIIRQLRRLGASCDWRRTRFTMDEGLSDAVAEVFLQLHDRGLIYRGSYIINWCPRCQTALSDEEAPRQETQGKLYHIRYPLAHGAGRRAQGKGHRRPGASSPEPPASIEVATTRPETMLGDTAVAVHPKDKRYQVLIGRHAILPLVGRRLPIIADDAVDREFGTGVVKVTPAHDPVDFRLGTKHGLEFVNVMTDEARMAGVPPAYEGLDRFDCRSKLIVDLEREGFLGAIDEHVHHVGRCYRCNTVVEPRLSLQWFVRMKPLAQPAIRAVKDGRMTFVPSRWTKVYLNWMDHIEDWCISRQIWWGHRLPVWYCDTCVQGSRLKVEGGKQKASSNLEPRTSNHAGVLVSKTRPERCPACGSTELRQDPDVLDTWFSSWLWPFSTLGWPSQTKDLARFYPTSTLVTAQEIIFFWVARMIMAGYFCLGQPPFRRVYIHGTVRDLTGKKMSKSLGNIIDPLDIIEKYGTDALRYTLVTATAIGQDILLSEERFVVGRNFANKLWNATRFVLSVADGSNTHPHAPTGSEPGLRPARSASSASRGGRASGLERAALAVPDRWILSRLQRTIERVTRSLDALAFNDAAGALYDFLWHDFCDWYLEAAKVLLAQRSSEAAGRRPEAGGGPTSGILVHVLETSLQLLHPIMPFITEELWQHLRSAAHEAPRAKSDGTASQTPRPEPPAPETPSLMRAKWPTPSKRLIDEEAERLFERFKSVVVAIRNTKADLHVPIDRRPPVRLVSKRAEVREFFEAHRALMQAAAQVGEVTVQRAGPRQRDAAATVVDGIEVVIPLAGLIDAAQERRRLQQRAEELAAQITQLDARLRDAGFTGKAPKEVVEQTRARRGQAQETLKKLSGHLAVLKAM